jgi:PAS domain S-box-containing protein
LKKIIFILSLFIASTLLLQGEVLAQNLKRKDSLENYIKSATTDSAKANALIVLSSDLIQYDIKKAELYATEALSISHKIKSRKLEADAFIAFSRIHRIQNNFSQAHEKAIVSSKIYQELNDTAGLADSYFELGCIYKGIHIYKKSMEDFTKSLQLYREVGNNLKVVQCQTLMGHLNIDRAHELNEIAYLNKALSLYTGALEYYKKIKNKNKISEALVSIANVYLNYNQLSPSDTYLNKVIDYSNQSLKISRELKDELSICYNLINIGEAYYAQKKYTLALDYFFKSYEAAKKSKNVNIILVPIQDIAMTYKEIKEYDKALEFSKKYIKTAKENRYKGDLKNHYKLLSEIYLAQNNPTKAYENRLIYESYSDSVLNKEMANALIKMRIEYESENKDKEIALLNQNRELQNAKLMHQNTIRNYLIASILLILLLLTVIYNRFVVKTKANKIIEEKNKELQKLSIVARETANGVFITDANGTIEWFNEGFSKLFGWKSIEEYRKERGTNIFEVSGNDNISNLINESINEKKSVTYENATPTKNQNQLWIQTTLTPIYNQEWILDKLVFVETDVTELKNSEEQLLEANKELEAFSYSVSHDLRAPLRAISGYSKILQEDCASKLTADEMNNLNSILNNSQKMGGLIDDLLTFSRLGRTQLTTSEINMVDLVQSVIEEEMVNKSNEIEFIVNDLPSAKGTLTLIRQVWINLISNAIKYSNQNPKARIEIGAYYKDRFIVYFVKDNGAGFDMKYYDKLFGVFQRLHSQDEFQGTGIGLAIVQKIIHRHHGTVWAESTLKENTTFYFSLPNDNS